MDTTVYITDAQYTELLTAINGISERLNTLIADNQKLVWLFIFALIFYGMAKMIYQLMMPIASDY